MMVRVYRNGGHYSHECEMKASTPLVLEPARTYILTYIHIHIWVGLTMGYTLSHGILIGILMIT